MTAGIKANVDGSGAIQVGGTDVIGLATSGNVGIGTSSPTVYGSYRTLEVRGTGGGVVQFGTGATTAAYLFQDGTNSGFNNIANGVMTFGTNNTERMRIDSSGNVGIGTSSPDSVANFVFVEAGSSGTKQGIFQATDGTTEVAMYSNSGLGIVSTRTAHPLALYTNGSERMRIDTNGNVGIGLTPTGTGFLEIKAGTTSAVPFELTAGTNASTAVAGGVEYDGRVFYATPQGTQRGVVPGSQFFRLNSGLVGANVNTAQNTFGVGVTLSASTVYAFEALVIVSKSAGTTSHNYALNFGGTATLNNIFWQSIGGYILSATPSGSLTLGGGGMSNAASAVTVQGSIGSAAISIVTAIRGTVSINAGGTFIPQYTLSAAPGGAYTTVAGSYFLIYPIGAAGANTSVGTWA